MSANIYESILRPLVTEKSTRLANRTSETRGGTYAFAVPLDSTKAQIRDAVEKAYNVRVVGVRTIVREGKLKRTRSGMIRRGTLKKAFVTLDPKHTISLF